MKKVTLTHPKLKDATATVPETTAENLKKHGGWKVAPKSSDKS